MILKKTNGSCKSTDVVGFDRRYEGNIYGDTDIAHEGSYSVALLRGKYKLSFHNTIPGDEA